MDFKNSDIPNLRDKMKMEIAIGELDPFKNQNKN